jgi:isopenicillin-N N-acyltransferase-like protein
VSSRPFFRSNFYLTLLERQAENLILLKIQKGNGLNIQMITEAGIIGKIGLNSDGVGCTLNAIKAHGVSYNKLPCHLALRTVMESPSREVAVSTLKKAGLASACHILVADATGGAGLECSSEDLVKLDMNREGTVIHTNHYILKHKETVVESPDWLPDTKFRLVRIKELLKGAKEEEPSREVAAMLLKDETEGDGAAICRSAKFGKEPIATLFSIVMDLGSKKAKVAMGRPVNATEILILSP